MAGREKEPPSRKARLLSKTMDRLSVRRKDDSTEPLRRRKTTPGRPSQPQKPENQRRATHELAPLVFTHPPPRVRSLTPSPFEPQSELRLKTDEQTQSLLFKLPDEILLMIYKQVVGNTLIHIVRRQRKLGHTICQTTGDPDDCREEQCRGFKLPTGTYVHTGEANGDSIQLLQTCRKIYADAIPLLYSSNTFEFDSMESFVSFSCALFPQRFDTIRSVRLDLRFNLSLYFSESTCFNDWPRWERTWRILSTMGSLQRLWVRIVWPRALYDQEERRFTQPLWILTRMKTFEVSLPPLKDKENNFRKYEEKEWGKEVPFRIVRRSTS